MAGTNLGTAWIQIKPTTSGITSAVKKELEAVEKELVASSSKGSISGAFSTLGDTLGKTFKAAFLAGTAGLTAIVTQSVKNFSDFEQLSGGIQKIFDEMDYSTIYKDAQRAYKELNISANEYMEKMTGVGATFAQTMGDKKGYDTAKRGLQSLADYASGTGKSIDLLMDKYQAITRSASGYLSIADQFAGILPQTTKDFLEQAQQSGFLADSYKTLTEVPVAEYQEAITKMIEKGVGSMNLLGNTTEESEKTISGSFNAMKSAWSDFTTSLADPANQNLDENIEKLSGSFFNLANNVIPVAVNAVGNIFGLLWEKQPVLMTIVTALGLIGGAIWAINTAMNVWKAATTAFTAVQTIFNAVMNANPIFLLVTAITAVVTAFTLFFTCTEQGRQFIEDFGNTVASVFSGIWDTVTGIFGGIAEFFVGVWDRIVSIFTGIGVAIGEAVSGAFKSVVNGILGFIEGFINTPIDILNGFIGIINDAFGWVGVNLGKITRISLPRLASGGIVEGIGSGTSDSNLYALSKGEYVIRAAAAQEIGYDRLDAMNKTGNVGGGNVYNVTINGYNKNPEELWQEFSRKIAFAQKGVY